MGRDLYNNSRSARDLMDQVCALPSLEHIHQVTFEGPEDLLTRTDNVQPAITTVSLMAWLAINEAVAKVGKTMKPLACAGHSLGEYAAHTAAGNLSPLDAVKLTAARGGWMNEASQPPNPSGGMVAVMGIGFEKIDEIVADSGADKVAIANINSPGQIILSGEATAIAAVSSALTVAGAKRVIPLNVSGAWHSPLMKSAQVKMAGLLGSEIVEGKVSINKEILVVANATSDVVDSTSVMKDTLAKQITSPVVWTECVRRLLTASGYPGLPSEFPGHPEPWPIFVEIGPGKVLRGLLRSIDKGIETAGVEDSVSLEAFLSVIS